jgi:hypothetical protein
VNRKEALGGLFGGIIVCIGFALIFVIPLSINVAMNGNEAVIDITPRNANERRLVSALWPCVVGWAFIVSMTFACLKIRKVSANCSD